MDYKSIHTLEDLQKAKATLRNELSVSRHELLRTLEMTRSQGTRLFWRGLALPAGLLGLGAVGMRAARNSFDNQVEKGFQTLGLNNEPDSYGNTDTDDNGGKWYMELIPIAINLFQTFMANRKNNNDSYQLSDEDDEEYYQAEATYPVQEAMSSKASY